MTIHIYTYAEVIIRQSYRLLRKDRVRQDNEDHHTTILVFFQKVQETTNRMLRNSISKLKRAKIVASGFIDVAKTTIQTGAFGSKTMMGW